VAKLPLKSKKRALILLGAFLVLSIVFYISPIRWKLIGFIRNEEFYRNMPVSYWKNRIEADNRIKEMELWQKVSRLFEIQDHPFKISEDDEEAKVLLRTLIQDKDALMRRWAVAAIVDFKCPSPEEISILCEGAKDPDQNIQIDAIQKIAALGNKAKIAVPTLVGLLDNPLTNGEAAIALSKVDPKEAEAQGIRLPITDYIKLTDQLDERIDKKKGK